LIVCRPRPAATNVSDRLDLYHVNPITSLWTRAASLPTVSMLPSTPLLAA
jgi:hypothetical protein